MKKGSGFTLMELVITIVLFSILAGVVAWVFVAGLKLWNSGLNSAEIRKDSAFALEIMTRELSQTNDFTIAQESQVKFDADIDSDGTDETVTYAIDTNELTRTVDGVETILSTDVDSFTLSYIDVNGDDMSFPITGGDRDDIRVVAVLLGMDRGDETLVIGSAAYTRNQ